jgi:hypothetical protein
MKEEIDFLNIQDIIKIIIIYFEKKNYEYLHLIENKVLEQAITEFSKDFSEICVLIYGLRKLISKKHIVHSDSWIEYEREIISNLTLSLENYRPEDPSRFNNYIKKVISIIKKADQELGRYVSVVIDDGRVKLASTAYAYGLSASQAANLLSITKEQLMSYVGITKMPDEDKPFKSIFERYHILDIMSSKNKEVKK